MGPLLKAYQEEIDHLTSRAKFSESSFFQLCKGLYAAPDPAPAIKLAVSSLDTDERIEENKKLKRALKEYKAEFASLKNQDITIRKLEEQVAVAANEQENIVLASRASFQDVGESARECTTGVGPAASRLRTSAESIAHRAA